MYGIQAGDCETLVEPKTKEGRFENAGPCPGGRLNCGPVLATDPSGLCDNPVHLHNPPRHLGRVTSTCAYRPQPEMWTLKWYLTLLQSLLAAGRNCPGTQTETCPSVPLRQVHWLCSNWILEQLHNPTPPLKALVQKQCCHPGACRETCSSVPLRQAYQHWSDCGSWSGPVTQYKPLSAAAPGAVQSAQESDGRLTGLCLWRQAYWPPSAADSEVALWFCSSPSQLQSAANLAQPRTCPVNCQKPSCRPTARHTHPCSTPGCTQMPQV